MTNWKTTLGGLIAGLPLFIDAMATAYANGQFTDKTGTQSILAIGIVLLGVFSKDHNTTGGTIKQ